MRMLSLVVMVAIFIALRLHFNSPDYKEGDSVVIYGKVRTEPIRFSSSQMVSVDGLYAFVPMYPEISYGDRIQIEGIVAEESKLVNPKVVSIEINENFLYGLRKRMVRFYESALPTPHAGLVSGMTIGSKALLPRDFWEKLKISGTAHVVVASGMNVSLVANFIVNSLITITTRRRAATLALIGIWIYSIVAGFEAPIIRASIMASIGILGVVTGRVRYAVRSLVGSAMLMLIIKPVWIWDLGFILSFAATASLMIFEAPIRRRLRIVPRIIRQDLSTSLAAQIGVFPILYYAFGYSNMWSPFINTLILWTVVPITLIGGAGVLIGLMIPTLGRIILITTYPLTWWFVEVVEFVSI